MGNGYIGNTPAWSPVGPSQTTTQIGGYYRTLVYTSTGANTWTKQANLKRIRVTVVGGGGSGAGCAATSGTQCSIGQSGGGGGTSIKTIEAASLGSNETVTVGAKGTKGAAGAAGTAGGTSSFGAHCSATGGAAGAVGGPTSELSIAGAAGGIGSGGDINISGRPSTAIVSWGGHFVCQASAGGSTHGQPDYAVTGSNPGAAPPAGNYGAGGTGASNDVSQSARQGGDGSAGIVIVEEFY